MKISIWILGILIFLIITILFIKYLRKNIKQNDILTARNPRMNISQIQTIRNFIEQKANALKEHEDKTFVKIGFDLSKYKRYDINGRVFFSISTRVFREILDNVLPVANQKYPDKFGARNAHSVLEAIYLTSPFGRPEDFQSLVGTEQFSWIIELKENNIIDRILRVDLFRKIEANENGSDFTGGIFHAFKHFSYRDIPLSTHNEINNLPTPSAINRHLIVAFFFGEGEQVSPTHYRAVIPLDDNYNLRFEFYFEQNSEVYFVNTIIKEKKRDNSFPSSA